MNSAKKPLIIILCIVALGIISASAYYQAKQSEQKPPENKTLTLKVYFHKNDPENCDVTAETKRTIPYTLQTANAALQELFKGPTDAEKESGLSSTFEPNLALSTGYIQGEPQPLGTYYEGVTIQQGLAVIDFSREALAYLNSPACLQAAVKSPMIQTLLQFPTIKQVEFSIDGEIYTEWGA